MFSRLSTNRCVLLANIDLLVVLGFLTSGCVSTEPPTQSKRATEIPEKATLGFANGFAGLYWSSPSEIRAFNSMTGSDSLLIPNANNFGFQKKLSPNERFLAIGFQSDDTLITALYDHNTSTLKRVHRIHLGKKIGQVNLAWKSSSDLLYFNYWAYKQGTPGSNIGSFKYYVSKDSLAQSKVSNGAVIETWIEPDFVVMSYDKTIYIINPATGKPTYTLNGVENPEFSPDGKKLLYYKRRDFVDDYGRDITIPELYISDVNGKNQKKVASASLKPSHASWLSDSQSLIVEVQSQEYSNKKLVVIYDIRKGELTYTKGQAAEGSSSEDPQLSPDRSKLLVEQWTHYEDYYGRRWSDILVTVSDLQRNSTKIVTRGRVDLSGTGQTIPTGGFTWLSNDLLISIANRQVTLYDLLNDSERSLADVPIHLWRIR
jgi:hypothetical protein